MSSDSPEPFDQNCEVTLNRANREIWKKALDKQHRTVSRSWKIVAGWEWAAGVAMLLGFGFLSPSHCAICNQASVYPASRSCCS